MQIMVNLPQETLTRQERLLIWLRRAGITKAAVAKALGVGNVSVTRWFAAESISSWRHRQLVEFGIPEELLPPIRDITPGPKPAERPLALAAAQ